jgi:hypothetical protein
MPHLTSIHSLGATRWSLHLQASHQFTARIGTYHALFINLITPRTKVLTFHQIQCGLKNGFGKLGSCFRSESELTRGWLVGISRPWRFLEAGNYFWVGFGYGSCMAWSIYFENYIDSTLLISSFSSTWERQLTSPAWVIICLISDSLYFWAGL